MSSPAAGRIWVWPVLSILLVAGFFTSTIVGQLPIGPTEVLGTVLQRIGVETPLAPPEALIAEAIWQIRIPRAVLSLLVGAMLALAGTLMQAVFGNPLADPGVVGVSAGAALGAALAIVFGLNMLGEWSVAGLAFSGGLVATVLVYTTARSQGRTEVVTLLLTGIAVNAFCGAGIAVAVLAGNTSAREQIVFWQLGSLNGSRWSEVTVAAVTAAVTIGVAFVLGRRYDLLALGERTAAHLGLRVEQLRILTVLLVALATGVAVAFTGIIAFVGLVVPHTMRMLIGPAHRALLLASVLAGSVLLVWADLVARTVIPSTDLPIGLLTSLIGGPFFFFLVRQTRRQAGGWA